jgi:hypothetical protein
VVGQPRATKVLRHLAAGAIRAAERFARESVDDSLKLVGESFADRARLIAHFRSVSDPPRETKFDREEMPTPSRRPSSVLRPMTATNLSAEVDRILNPSLAAAERRRGSVPPPAGNSTSNPTMPSLRLPANNAPQIARDATGSRSVKPILSSRSPAPARESGEVDNSSGEFGPLKPDKDDAEEA